jgi:hypothetical protein
MRRPRLGGPTEPGQFGDSRAKAEKGARQPALLAEPKRTVILPYPPP